MKVAILAGPIPYTVALCRALSQYCTIDLFCSERYARQNDCSIFAKLPKNVTVILFKEYRRRDPRSVISYHRLCKDLRNRRYDILHLQYEGTIGLLLFWHRLKNISMVFTVHDPYHHPGKNWLYTVVLDFLQYTFIKKAKAIIVHGDRMRKDFLKRYPFMNSGQIYSLPHGDLSICFGRDIPIQIPPKKNIKNILFFGNIRPHKGLEYLIKTEPILSKYMKNFKIYIVGTCYDASFIRHIKNPDRFCIIRKYVSNREAEEFFSNADVVVLPYTHASQTGIIPLAYAIGKPVVATNVGGIPDVVEHGKTGLLVSPCDEKALAEAILSILNNVSFHDKLVSQALEYCKKNLSWEPIAKKTHAIYLQMLENQKAEIQV